MMANIETETTRPELSDSRPRFLSEADCRSIIDRLAQFCEGGGSVWTYIRSDWNSGVRWSRNRVQSGGEDRNNFVQVWRTIGGSDSTLAEINDISDTALMAAVRRTERAAKLRPERPLQEIFDSYLEPVQMPNLFDEATYQIDAGERATVAHKVMQSAVDAGMMSAGYLATSAHSAALLDSLGRSRYVRWTQARYTVTVRDPKGTGSGWAGIDTYDWKSIDTAKLSAIALEKCLNSRNPVRVEPGRHTAILEPQAVGDFVSGLFTDVFDRNGNENPVGGNPSPFLKTPPQGGDDGRNYLTLIGQKIMDERLSLSADPMDPEMSFAPFDLNSHWLNGSWSFKSDAHHPATWVEHGVLRNLAYNRYYAMSALGRNEALLTSGSFRMSGGPTSIEEMIATTKRGLLVTRFDSLTRVNDEGLVYRGYTRDGLWLIENGKISKPVKNMAMTEGILFALNNVEQIGPAQRIYHPGRNADNPLGKFFAPQPVIVPPLKIRDFSFTSLSDAV